MKKSKHKSFYSPEISLFLIAIPLISAFNYFLTYSSIKLNLFLLITFTIDTLQGYLAWICVRQIIFYLDKKLPFSKNLSRRITVQIIITTFCGLVVIASTTELLSWLVKSRPAPLDFYTLDLLIISIWFWVINGFYIGMYFYRQWENLALENQKEEKRQGIFVKKGSQNLLIKFKDICLFAANDDYVQMIDQEGRKFIVDQSLIKLEKELPPNDFLRVNRKFILHRQIIEGFKRIENGKLLLQVNLEADFEAEFTVSRTKAPTFKRWFLHT